MKDLDNFLLIEGGGARSNAALLPGVFQRMAYHAGLTLKYTVMRLSPRLGLVQAEIWGPSGAGQL
ncbi:hypothetical protein [Cupriavidus lacunae]|uniref:Uncharacterized protein n=1 Tax=Cupriavidus lacunae TaxID=2666307 RepID=A0A370NHG7_9BURK|nr:hypothetical protein [Cupriavidus lacunae]RDK05020.1 hypothetical protein DN412_39375 [Cupriavidus lacunae]